VNDYWGLRDLPSIERFGIVHDIVIQWSGDKNALTAIELTMERLDEATMDLTRLWAAASSFSDSLSW
jgi:hypothetical protein